VPIKVLDVDAPDAVFAFLDETMLARGQQGRGREHWCWKYRLGAVEPLAAAPPSGFYWQQADGRVIGFIGLMRTTLHTAQQRHPAAWFVDWHVTPGEGGVGVGLGLLRKAEAAAGILLTLQGSKDTRQILPRLGWKSSVAPATCVRRLTSRAIAAPAERRVPPWARGAARLAGAAAGRYVRCRKPPSFGDAELVQVDRFPPEYDEVWQLREAEFAPAMTRDSSYMNYLCADYPDGGYRLQLARCGGKAVGHLLWRVDPDRGGLRRGRIVDVLWPRVQPELGTWLVETACWQLQEAGADYVECVASVSDLSETLRRTRFRSRSPVPLWYHRLPAGVPEPDRWYVTFLDCDRAYR
jgi:hypothetical protein